VTHAAAFNRLPCLPDDCTVPFDFGFGIRALVALAPADGGYRPAGQPPPVEDVSYLVLHGTHDGDVSNFQGLRPFRRVRFTDDPYRFKAAVVVGGADHAGFSTGLGDSDLRGPFRGFALTPPLAPEAQRRAARALVGGFLEAAVRGDHRYVSMFRDLRGAAAWLPDTAYVSQFEDSTYRPLADFTGGVDLGRGTLPGSRLSGRHLTVWREGPFKGRGPWPFQFRVLSLGWGEGGDGEPASWRITLPEGAAARWGLHGGSRLVVTAADARAERGGAPLDLTVELATADGARARLPLTLPRTPRVRFTKWPFLDRAFFFEAAEPALQTYEFPLRALADAGGPPSRLGEVRLVFDRARAGTIVVSSVGVEGAPAP